MQKIKFILNGCDIFFTAEAPPDITLIQLLKQCDRIVPDYCACGIRSFEKGDCATVELSFDYNDVKKIDEDAACSIKE